MMNKRDRIHAAIQGGTPDRPPVALWRHFPLADQDAAALARAHLDWQVRYDWDLLKVTPTSGYAAEDWGLRSEHRGNRDGTRTYLDYPVKAAEDWRKLRPLDVHAGVLGRELAALRLIRAGSGPDLHILQTIFSPLTIAKNLGRDRLLADLRGNPADVHAALAVIAQTTAAFAEASLASGADAVFFATQFASYDLMTEAEYQEFGVRYDEPVLAATAGRADFVLLHAHGTHPMFALLADYPVQVINWHDRTTPPTLALGQKRFAGAVAGGLDEWGALQAAPAKDRPNEAAGQAWEAIAQTGGQRFILAPGCVLPIDTPEENIRAVRAAVGN
jgi:uroporphyrinogen decarboxylase